MLFWGLWTACVDSAQTGETVFQTGETVFESPQEVQCGTERASHNGVSVYSNGVGISSCAEGRHMSSDNYSYGKKWQCVEFVRRYYKDHLHHKMPSPWGNAKDYFLENIPHGAKNPDRNLLQFRNGNTEKPKADDLLVCPQMAGGYGHVAIIMDVKEDYVEIIQQNTLFPIEKKGLSVRNGLWTIEGGCAGFLRKETR